MNPPDALGTRPADGASLSPDPPLPVGSEGCSGRRDALLVWGNATAPGRQVLVRADSAFCAHENVAAATRAGAWFSFTIPQWKTVTTAIAGIDESAWSRIEYPNAV